MQQYSDGTGQGPYTITMTAHQQSEYTRAAKALYARGANDLGHLLSAVAAKAVVPIQQYDRAASAYRAWLVFDEPNDKPTASSAWRAIRS